VNTRRFKTKFSDTFCMSSIICIHKHLTYFSNQEATYIIFNSVHNKLFYKYKHLIVLIIIATISYDFEFHWGNGYIRAPSAFVMSSIGRELAMGRSMPKQSYQLFNKF
jgi:hypothetical protein